jgi:hypothetical protein
MNSFRRPPPRPTIDNRDDYIPYEQVRRIGGNIGTRRGEALYFDDHSSQGSWMDRDQRIGKGNPRRPVENNNHGSRDQRPSRNARHPQDSFESSEYSYDRHIGPVRGPPPRGIGRPPSPNDFRRPPSPRGIRRPPSPRGRGEIYGRGGIDMREDYEDHGYGYEYSADDSFSEARRDAPIPRRGPRMAVDHMNGSIHEYPREWRAYDHDSRSLETESMRTESMASGSLPSSAASPRRWQRRGMSFSSDTVSSYGRRPEYDGAKPSSDLPQGYMRRKDGVVLSMGSSMGSVSDVTERYVDPEIAARNVVENLASKGYEYTEGGGINMSGSTNSIEERYGINQNKNSKKTRKTETARKERLTSLEKIPKSQQEGSVMEIMRSFEEMANGAQQTPATAGRAKVKNCDDISGPLGASLGSRDTSSSGSVFRAKAKVPPGRAVSTHSNNSGSERQYESRQLKMNPEKSAVPAVSDAFVVKEFDVSRIVEDTLSRGDTTHNDESTISTKEQYPRRFPSISQPVVSGIIEKAVVDGESETVERTISKKSVGFCGEMPPQTKAGDRVPEMVARLPMEVLPSVSDISSMPRSGQSAAPAVLLQGTALDKMERFFEQFALTCRLAVFQPARS